MAQRATIYLMNIITLLLSIAAVILSGCALSVALSVRRDATIPASTPDAGTRGAGGSGRR